MFFTYFSLRPICGFSFHPRHIVLQIYLIKVLTSDMALLFHIAMWDMAPIAVIVGLLREAILLWETECLPCHTWSHMTIWVMWAQRVSKTAWWNLQQQKSQRPIVLLWSSEQNTKVSTSLPSCCWSFHHSCLELFCVYVFLEVSFFQ